MIYTVAIGIDEKSILIQHRENKWEWMTSSTSQVMVERVMEQFVFGFMAILELPDNTFRYAGQDYILFGEPGENTQAIIMVFQSTDNDDSGNSQHIRDCIEAGLDNITVS